MQKKIVWLDCDPGHDDMFAIIMAAFSDEIELLGISTSAGNSYIENTTQNALNILYEIGKTSIKVVQGSEKPLCRNIEIAEDIHGKSGLEGAELMKSPFQAIQEKPFLYIYQKIINHKQMIEIVVTGSLTNTAILLNAFPDIKTKLRGITLMGGAIGLGNWSPAAQFNILVDPEAASSVFQSGVPITMIPLEVTHTALATEEVFSQFSKLQSSFSQKLVPLLRYFQKQYKKNQDFDFPAVHDPCTIYYLLNSSDFEGRKAFVEIQLEGKSKGRTNCSFMHKVPNAFVCQKVNVANFWKSMLKCIKMIK